MDRKARRGDEFSQLLQLLSNNTEKRLAVEKAEREAKEWQSYLGCPSVWDLYMLDSLNCLAELVARTLVAHH